MYKRQALNKEKQDREVEQNSETTSQFGLQAAQAATNTIPILGTSVTEYGVALGLDNFSGTVGGCLLYTSRCV